MAVVGRLEVLWCSRQKCFQVALSDVSESNHPPIHLKEHINSHYVRCINSELRTRFREQDYYYNYYNNFTALWILSGAIWVSQYQKGKIKTNLDFLEQETVNNSEISWTICKSAPCSSQITMPGPHHSFLQAVCPSCHPTNSVKALKA